MLHCDVWCKEERKSTSIVIAQVRSQFSRNITYNNSRRLKKMLRVLKSIAKVLIFTFISVYETVLIKKYCLQYYVKWHSDVPLRQQYRYNLQFIILNLNNGSLLSFDSSQIRSQYFVINLFFFIGFLKKNH